MFGGVKVMALGVFNTNLCSSGLHIAHIVHRGIKMQKQVLGSLVLVMENLVLVTFYRRLTNKWIVRSPHTFGHSTCLVD